MVLLDNGAQINTIMPKYVSDHSLQMGPITDLLGAKVACLGLGAGESREGPHWWAYQHHDSGIMGWRQLFAAGSYCTKCVHRVETR